MPTDGHWRCLLVSTEISARPVAKQFWDRLHHLLSCAEENGSLRADGTPMAGSTLTRILPGKPPRAPLATHGGSIRWSTRPHGQVRFMLRADMPNSPR